MCEICKNNQLRTNSHALNKYHRKKLIEYFRKIKSGEIQNHLSKYYKRF